MIGMNPMRAVWRLEGARRLRNHLTCLTAGQIEEVDDLLDAAKAEEAFVLYARLLRERQADVMERRGDWIPPTIPVVDVAHLRVSHVSSTGHTVNTIREDGAEWAFRTARTDGQDPTDDLRQIEEAEGDPRLLDTDILRQVRKMIECDLTEATYRGG